MKQPAHILVYGTGIAGMMAAWHAMELGAKVALAGLVDPLQSADARWRTGIRFEHRSQDVADQIVLNANGLANASAANAFAHELEKIGNTLSRLGVRFALSPEGHFQTLAYPGASSGHQILTWSLGRQVLTALAGHMRRFVNSGQLRLLAGTHFLAPLLSEAGACAGAVLQNRDDLSIESHLCDALIICDSDQGALFNSLDDLRVGQASAALYKAGAALANLEFMARGLVMKAGWGRSVPVPETWFSLAASVTTEELLIPTPKNPALVNELDRLTNGSVNGEYHIPMHEGFVDGLGGLWADRFFAGSLPGLYVAGEGLHFLHGALRIPGLVVAECLHSGFAAAQAACNHLPQAEPVRVSDSARAEVVSRHEFLTQYYLDLSGPENAEDLRESLQTLMNSVFAGPGNKRQFENARSTVGDLRERFHRSAISDRGRHVNQAFSRMMQLDGLLELADATLAAALCRQESRGCFRRDDFAVEDDFYKKTSKVLWSRQGPRVVYEDVGSASLPATPVLNVVGGQR